jgi:hypothetical protein
MNDAKVWLTIPTGTRREYLSDIIKYSQIPLNQIVIVHTVESFPIEGVHNVWDLDPPNIQRWWNIGIDIARANGGDYIAVLNDDLILKDDPINRIVKGMKQEGAVLGYPYPHTGNGATRVAGYCWVLDLSFGLRTDETYRWYFGDDDLLLQAVGLGKAVYVPAIVDHMSGVVETNKSEYLKQLTIADRKYFIEKWSKRFERNNKGIMIEDTPLNQMLIALNLHSGSSKKMYSKDQKKENSEQ